MNKSKYTKCNKPCDFQPSKEEEKHKLCSDYQKACNQCYQEFKDWQKSDESKSQSWEEELIKIINNIEPWGYSESRKIAYEEIKSLLTTAIDEERKNARVYIGKFKIMNPKNGKIWISKDDGGEFDEKLFEQHIEKFYKKYF